jgi:hypothetical protein
MLIDVPAGSITLPVVTWCPHPEALTTILSCWSVVLQVDHQQLQQEVQRSAFDQSAALYLISPGASNNGSVMCLLRGMASQAVMVCSFSPSVYAQRECFLMHRNCTCRDVVAAPKQLWCACAAFAFHPCNHVSG